MSTRFSRKEIKDILKDVDLNPGEQIHVHHCKFGKHNDRLYITRTIDGAYLLYCHHCGLSGYNRANGDGGPQRKVRRGKEDNRNDYSFPRDATSDTTKWWPLALAWVRTYGIKDDELATNSVGYSEHLGAIVFPFNDENGVSNGYQYRPCRRTNWKGDRKGQDSGASRRTPKYITCRKPGSQRGDVIFFARPSWSSVPSGNEHSRPSVVLVEDVISAIKVSRVPRNIGVAIMGSSLSPDQAIRIARFNPAKVWIFMDNDNEMVRTTQRKAKRLLEPLVSGPVEIIKADRDPKAHATSELEELLK